MNTTQMDRKHASRRVLLNRLYEYMPVGVEQRDLSSDDFSGDGVSASQAKDYLKDIEGMGILTRRLEYGGPTNGMQVGRHFHYTLNMPKEEAMAILSRTDAEETEAFLANTAAGIKASAERRRGKPQPKATPKPVVTVEPPVTTVAIAGPDPENPFGVLASARKNESYAIVEAARQYRDRSTRMEDQITSLLAQASDLGLHVDEDALRASITPDRVDDRLEHIGLALPYIAELERTLQRNELTIASLRKQIAQYEADHRELLSLRQQNQRLISKQVQLTQ